MKYKQTIVASQKVSARNPKRRSESLSMGALHAKTFNKVVATRQYWHIVSMKQVIVVNDALKLPKGKLSAQVAHASLSAFLAAAEDTQQEWLGCGMPKIVLKCASEMELKELLSLAQNTSLPACLIQDAGRTLLAQGTITCLGIGPARDTEIDMLTGDMALL